MRAFIALGCLAACVGVAKAQTEDRLEFSGLTSPCDEVAGDQEDTLIDMGDTNIDIASQLEDLQARVENELLTYGDTTNICDASFCTIGGGQNNQIDEEAVFSFVRGGKGNWCYLHSPYSTISGGQSNVATGDYCSIGGGIKNKCYSNYATIGGGYLNMANARFATVLGGSKNSAQGRYSLAGGYDANSDADYAATFGLLDGTAGCVNDNENSVKICSEAFVLNGVDYASTFSTSRRLQEDATSCKTSEEARTAQDSRLKSYEKVVSALTSLLSSSQ